MIQVRQDLGSVLSVAVQQDDDVEALVDEVAVAGLLIAAVAEVPVVLEDVQLGQSRMVFRPTASSKVASWLASSKTATSSTLFHTLGVMRFKNLGQRGDRVVGDDQNADALAVAWGQFRVVLPSSGAQSRERFIRQPERPAGRMLRRDSQDRK